MSNALPPTHFGGATLPTTPSDPIHRFESGIGPTNDDALNGQEYLRKMTASTAGSEPYDEASEPPWFAAAVQRELKAPLASVKDMVDRASLASLKHMVDRALRLSTRNWNLLCGNGRIRPFEIVPFSNGDLPIDPPHNLPPLTDVDRIVALTGAEAADYVEGYGLAHVHEVRARKRAIAVAIGCTDFDVFEY